MSIKVPTSFIYDNKLINAELKFVHGSGNLYHLMVDGYYWGQLHFSSRFGWQFSSNTVDLHELSDYFGEHIAIAADSL